MVQKNYSVLNCVNFRLCGWYIKSYVSHKRNTAIYRLSFIKSSKYSGWRSRYQSVFGMKMAMSIKILAAVVGNIHVTRIKFALVSGVCSDANGTSPRGLEPV